jgi:hypothetical protein
MGCSQSLIREWEKGTGGSRVERFRERKKPDRMNGPAF